MDPDQEYQIVDKRGTNRNVNVKVPGAELNDADLELLRQQAAADESTIDADREHVVCVFAVAVHFDGRVTATSELKQLDVWSPEREATFADMYTAAAHMQKDIGNTDAAMRVLELIQAQAMASQQALQQAAVREQMARGVPRGFRG